VEVLYLLIPLSVFLALVIALAFVFAIRSGQFDDLEGPAYRVLADEDEVDDAHSSAENSESQRVQR
jgi:cbb3-type cytochrome oxidase maturation protein